MGWCFAIINGKLAEIYEEYKTKKEQKYINQDTARFQFRFSKGIYKDLIRPNQFFEVLGTHSQLYK